MCPACYQDGGSLLHCLSTLTPQVRRFISVALVWESPPPDVIRHPALRSPDFPRLNPFVCSAAITWPGCASAILARFFALVKKFHSLTVHSVLSNVAKIHFKLPAAMEFIAILVNNAFKTVQQSAKDKEDICRRADARQRYLTQDFTL